MFFIGNSGIWNPLEIHHTTEFLGIEKVFNIYVEYLMFYPSRQQWVENTSSTSLHSTMISRLSETGERWGPGRGTTTYLTFQTQHNGIFCCLKNLRIYERFGKSMFFIGKNGILSPLEIQHTTEILGIGKVFNIYAEYLMFYPSRQYVSWKHFKYKITFNNEGGRGTAVPPYLLDICQIFYVSKQMLKR